MPIAGIQNENGFTSVDRSKRLHQTGVLQGPSDNLLNHYHTRYSSDYQFKPTRGLNERTRQDLVSGFAQNHHYQATGLNLPAHKPNTNFTSTYNSSFEKAATPQMLPQKKGVDFTEQSGFTKNNANVHPDHSTLGSSTTNRSEFRNHTGDPYPEYMRPGVYTTVVPANSGFVKNNRQQPTFNVSSEEAENWMKSTNVSFQESSERALRSTGGGVPQRGEPEKSGFSRSILRPPAQGVGSEHRKLGATYDMINDIPITDAQQLRILQKKKKDDPIGYQHALDGQQVWQSTYNLTHQNGTGALLAKGDAVIHGRPGAARRQPGDSYMKDMQGPYSTTTKRSQIFEATQQAYSVNNPQVVNRGWVTTGYTKNTKDPKSQQPWMNDMRAGVDNFSRGALTSSQVIGQGAARNGDAPVAPVTAILPRRTNEVMSSYCREYGVESVIPTGGINLRPASRQRSRPSSREVHGTVAGVRNYDSTVKRSMKNYGEGAVCM